MDASALEVPKLRRANGILAPKVKGALKKHRDRERERDTDRPPAGGRGAGRAGRIAPQKGGVNEQPLTIAMLREVLAQEREVDRANLVDSLESVKGDVRAIQSRVTSVETGVTAQMEKTLRMLDRITDNYAQQAKNLEEMKDTQDKFQKRLEALELKPQFSSAPGSTTDTDGGGGNPRL